MKDQFLTKTKKNMYTDNQLINWIVEMFKRLSSKSPKFFKVWKIITGIPVLIIALPNALQLLNIHLPQVFDKHVQDIVGWAASAMFFMSFLPSQSAVIAIDQNGTPVKQTNPEKLPFTAQQETKAALKEDNKISMPSLDKVELNNPIEPLAVKGADKP